MIDARKGHTYAAENVAFADTLLGERPGFNTLVAETMAVLTSDWWRSNTLPTVTVEQMISATLDGDANSTRNVVRYTHSAWRSVVPHELAHIATRKLVKRDIQAHGPEWRGTYVALTSMLYGQQYGTRLHKAFNDAGLKVELFIASAKAKPLVDIDAIGGVVCGGWRR